MDYRSVRFMGFDIHEDQAYERAQAAVKREMEEREPQKNGSNLYAPKDDFKKSVTDFREKYKEFGEALLKRAENGESVQRIEVKTLDRAERLYATALGSSMESVPVRLDFLNAGVAMHGKGNGLSLTRQVEIAAGLSESPHGQSGAKVEVSHHRF